MAVTGRYKSRALNYLVDQAQKLRSQAARSFRHATTGVTWGAQILLYPLYVAFQASRVVGRRLSAAASAPRELGQLPEFPKSDEPLSRVLSLAQGLVDGDSVAVAAAETVEISGEASVGANGLDADGIERRTVDPSTLDALRSPAPLPQLSDAALQPQADLWEMTDEVVEQALTAKPSADSSAIAPQTVADLVLQQPADVILTSVPGPSELVSPGTASSGIASSGPIQSGPVQSGVGDLAPRATTLPKANTYFIRGIASNLHDRALTLVDNQNRLVPISAEQQGELKQQMVQEAADFAYRRRRYLKSLFERQKPLAPPQSDRPTLFPMVRWTRNLMGWMQRSPVALGINLFNETQLPPAEVLPPSLAPLDDMGRWAARYLTTEQQQQFALAALDRVDAPLSTLEETYAKRVDPGPLGHLIRRAAAFFGLVERSPNPSERDPSPAAFSAPGLLGSEASSGERLPFEAGGAGTLPSSSLAGVLPASGDLTVATSIPGAIIAPGTPGASGPVVQIRHVGLEEETSGVGTGAMTLAAPNALISRSSPDSEAIPPEGKAAQEKAPQGKAPQDKAPEKAALLKAPSQTLTANPSISSHRAHSSSISPDGSSQLSPSETSRSSSASEASEAPLATAEGSPESAPTWNPSYIETTATVTGYIKHPLEWLLEKLDRLLLRIERTVAMIWRWFQAQFHPNR